MMKKFIALLKSKAGMTFVELLTALALLVIIITSFTPVLLNSYEWLYKAGEKNEETYNSKTTIEEKLATRKSTLISRYNVAFEGLTETMFLNMRKAMENCQNGIQTVFYGGKGTIRVVSPAVIPDDEPSKDITVQFNGINVTSLAEGGAASASKSGNDYQVAIQIICPKWDADTASGEEAFDPNNTETLLSTNLYSLTLTTKNGKKYAEIHISDGVDVVTTAVKIVAHYCDENGEKDKAEAYVRITPATIMMVGKTNSTVDYYTSKGVDKKDVINETTDSQGNVITTPSTVYDFTAHSRIMRMDNTPQTGIEGSRPSGTEFLSISYIDTDPDRTLDPYYVLTGTNGVIQRLFISKGDMSGTTSVTGYAKDSVIRSVTYKDGGLTKKLYPTFWGGDKSHQFGFSTAGMKDDDKKESAVAYDTNCWYTQDRSSSKNKYKGNTTFDKYNVQARMATFFNGYGMAGGGTDLKEVMRNGRKISYVLLESGTPLRLTGVRNNDSDSWGGYITTWETSKLADLKYSWISQGDKHEYSSSKQAVRIRRYVVEDEDNDSALSYINLKSFNNLAVSQLFDVGDADDKVANRLSNEGATNINITAAIFNSAAGKMMYLGSTPSYAYIQQVDNTSSNANYANKYKWHGSGTFRPTGSISAYLVIGSAGGGTTIKKASGSGAWEDCVNALKTNPSGTLKTDPAEFYVQRPGSSVTRLECPDVEFTLGYSSNREQVFANITYGLRTPTAEEPTEYHNSYERYYNLTHHGDLDRSNRDNNTYVSTIVDNPGTYINNSSNDMYNVWFPGEFYNLTHTATKEGITVAVGYTVSGSTYQWVNPSQTTNTSTSLGSIYNDGVLAVLTSEDESFKNLLYYKDFEKFDNSSITSNANVKAAYSSFGSYGTHARSSVRFTAVDICIHGGDFDPNTNQPAPKTYYAVYGDNHGRVFFSEVATVTGKANVEDNNNDGIPDNTVDNNNDGKPDDFVADTSTLVAKIGDLSTKAGSGFANMTEMFSTKTDPDGNKLSLSEFFSEIVSIYCDEKVVYVVGKSNSASGDLVVAVCDTAHTLEFTVITIETGKAGYLVNDMLVLGGYLYLAGETENGSGGFWYGIDKAAIDGCFEYNPDPNGDGNESDAYYKIKHESIAASVGGDPKTANKLFFQTLPTAVNSIAGRNV